MARKLIAILLLSVSVLSCQAAPDVSPTPTAKSSLTAPPTDPAPVTSQQRINLTTSGEIGQDEIWRDEIHLTGDIWLQNGAVLTIEPGTTVYLASLSDDQQAGMGWADAYVEDNEDPTRFDEWAQSTILIDGRGGVISAVGTTDALITFRPEGDSTSPAQWDGILIERGSIQHAVLLYGGHTVIQPLGQANEQMEIAYNEVRHFLWAGIDMHRPNVWVHHNVVEGGGHHAIGIHRDNVLVEHNVLTSCQTGVNLHRQSNTVIRNNLIIDCANAIALNGTNSVVTNNTVAHVEGPPEGWYFSGELVYPAFDYTGGIIGSSDGSDTILNNIIYGDFSYAIGYHGGVPALAVDVQYNLYWGTRDPYSGPGQSVISANNFNLDPLFSDPPNWDFTLLPDSPAVDDGAPEILDSDGSPSDLGAYGGPGGEGW